MNKEKQRIKIAELCGWRIASHVEQDAKLLATACWIRPSGNEWNQEVLPDYLNDLNAMHDAEKKFIGDASQAMTYAMHLLRLNWQNVSTENDDLNCDHAYITALATAEQRAEAFLKTLGLWEDEE